MSKPWDQLLPPGERILWEGSPLPGIRKVPQRLLNMAFGFLCLVLVKLALVDYLPKWAAEERLFSVVFLLVASMIFLLVGLFHVVLQWIVAAREHQATRYALGGGCALIAHGTGRLKFKCYPILPDTEINLDRHKGYDNLWFHVRRKPDGEGGVTTTRIGFEGIADGQKVYALMREIQTGTS